MDLRELYQEIIMDHNKNPRHHHDMARATHQAMGFNPLCGDKLTVYVNLQDDVIKDMSFVGCGCAISQASASMMTDALCGKTKQEALHLFKKFHDLLTQDAPPSADLGDQLNVLMGVRAYPARVKCATLAWHTMDSALKKDGLTASTE